MACWAHFESARIAVVRRTIVVIATVGVIIIAVIVASVEIIVTIVVTAIINIVVTVVRWIGAIVLIAWRIEE